MNKLNAVISELEQCLINSEHATPFDFTLGEQAIDSKALNSVINSLMAEGNIHRNHTWAAHMTAPISTASLLGQTIASLHNGNLLSPSLYPVLSGLEQQLLSWIKQLFHQPHGHFTSGSTFGNLEALWQAKKSTEHSRIVYASTAVHYSIVKACQILDLELKLIETDQNDRLIPDSLEAACKTQTPLAIIATIGTTSAGCIDPISACCDIAKRYEAWCHIDAAWGGALAILPEYRSLFEVCGRADSICFDPHKGWQQPKPNGVLLYKHRREPMMLADTNYLETKPLETLAGSYGGEMFLSLWFELLLNGLDTLKARVQKRLDEASCFYNMLADRANIEIYPTKTGIVCFSLNDMSTLDSLVIRGIFSKASVAGIPVYRAVFSHPDVQADKLINEIDQLL